VYAIPCVYHKDKGYFTGKKKDAEAQKVLLDAATEQARWGYE